MFPILFTTLLGSTEGTETLSVAKDVFDGKEDLLLNPWSIRRFPFGAPSGQATPRVSCVTYAVTGKIRDLFEQFNAPLERLCLEQGQIVDYARKNRVQILAGGVTCCLVRTGRNLEWDTHIRREEGGYTFHFSNLYIVGFGSLGPYGWEPRSRDGRLDYRVEAFHDDHCCEPWELKKGRMLVPAL